MPIGEIPSERGAAKSQGAPVSPHGTTSDGKPRKQAQLTKSASLTANAAVVWKSKKQKNAPKAGGQQRQFDVFLSYRQSADMELVKDLYWQLSNQEIVVNGKRRKLEVFWDKESFQQAVSWETSMPAAICNSTLVLVVLSKETCYKEGENHDMTKLGENDPADYVLAVRKPRSSRVG
jgi:hypothetical protein